MGLLGWLSGFLGWEPREKVSTQEAGRVLYSSPVPKSIAIGNLIYERSYREAIALGEELLKEAPDDASVHVNLMDAYFKARDLSPDYFDKSTYHARLAILCGHNTGYAHERLAINLERGKQYHKALQLYALILDTPGFRFSEHGIGNTIDFARRREKALAKLGTALDSDADVLFTEAETARILRSIK